MNTIVINDERNTELVHSPMILFMKMWPTTCSTVGWSWAVISGCSSMTDKIVSIVFRRPMAMIAFSSELSSVSRTWLNVAACENGTHFRLNPRGYAQNNNKIIPTRCWHISTAMGVSCSLNVQTIFCRTLVRSSFSVFRIQFNNSRVTSRT